METRLATKCTADRKRTDVSAWLEGNRAWKHVHLAPSISNSGHNLVETRMTSHANEHGAYRRGVRLVNVMGMRDRRMLGESWKMREAVPWATHFVVTVNFRGEPKGVTGAGVITGTVIVIGLMQCAPSDDPVKRQHEASTEGADAVMMSYVGMLKLAPALMSGWPWNRRKMHVTAAPMSCPGNGHPRGSISRTSLWTVSRRELR